jgi:hypothetical protein
MDLSAIRAGLQQAIVDNKNALIHLEALLADVDGADAVEVPRQGRWTKAAVQQLWDGSKHLPGVVALFEELAAHPGEDVSLDAVRERSGLDEKQQRNEHARMSRVSTSLFGAKRWPFRAWQGPAIAGGKAGMVYRMDVTVAQWWTEIVS